MLFPTKPTSLINTRGLIGNASLENHHNNRRLQVGATGDLNFLGGVCDSCQPSIFDYAVVW